MQQGYGAGVQPVGGGGAQGGALGAQRETLGQRVEDHLPGRHHHNQVHTFVCLSLWILLYSIVEIIAIQNILGVNGRTTCPATRCLWLVLVCVLAHL